MFDPSTDPLGIAVQQRARDSRWQQMLQGLQAAPGSNQTGGPLPDPQWEGYFQATDEAAGGKPIKYGYAGANIAPSIAGLDPDSDQPLGNQLLMRSSQLGSPYYGSLPKRRLNPTGLDPTSQTT